MLRREDTFSLAIPVLKRLWMRNEAIILNKITVVVSTKAFLAYFLLLPPDLEVNTYVKTLLQTHQSAGLAYLLLSLWFSCISSLTTRTFNSGINVFYCFASTNWGISSLCGVSGFDLVRLQSPFVWFGLCLCSPLLLLLFLTMKYWDKMTELRQESLRAKPNKMSTLWESTWRTWQRINHKGEDSESCFSSFTEGCSLIAFRSLFYPVSVRRKGSFNNSVSLSSAFEFLLPPFGVLVRGHEEQD